MNYLPATRFLMVIITVVLASALVGCAPIPYLDTAATAPHVPEPPRTERVASAPAEVPPPVRRSPQRTALILSDDIPEFASVAREIERLADFENLTVLSLRGNPFNAPRIKAEAEGADQVIAIGLLAATVGREIGSERLVFCQVFNYRDHDLISADSKGVNLMPPLETQLQQWTDLDPGLRSIGIITGPNQDDLIEEARGATEQHGIELIVRTVQSDKEALYQFKLLAPDIQGLWLLPDNRILSPEVVREIMANSARQRKQVVVFGTNLLNMGGLMSVTSDAADVAEQVLARLADVSADGGLAGPEMRPLKKIHVQVNLEIARHLGLAVPETIASNTAR